MKSHRLRITVFILMLFALDFSCLICNSSASFNPLIQQQELASDAGDSSFGEFVGLSAGGSTALVGKSIRNISDLNFYVFADVFILSGSTWTQQPAILGMGGDNNIAMALSADGNTVVIGDSTSHPQALTFSTRSGSTWTQQQQLTDPGSGVYFGCSVALSGDGNTALTQNDGSGVDVFTRSSSTWMQQATLTGSTIFACIPMALSFDGNTALIGAPLSADIYTRSGSTWTRQQQLAIQAASVALSADGNTALIGAYDHSANQRVAYVFARSGSTWTQQQELTASDGVTGTSGDQFNRSLALSADGNTAIVGAAMKNSGQGAAYVFTRSGSTWTQQQELTASDGVAGDQFGFSVTLSADGGTALVGAIDHNVGGAVYVFNRAIFAVNSGGSQYSDHSGVVCQADEDYLGGFTYATAAVISGTVDGTLYKTGRYGNFSYNIPLANGNYNVTLKFAEPYWTSAGDRVFDVSMQGQQVINNLDIFAHVGKNVAYDVTIPVSVVNGRLYIAFTSVVDFAVLSAIEIAQTSTPTPLPSGNVVIAVNAGGGQYTDTSGNVYRADTDYSGGATYSTNTAISGTGDGTLYQSLRYGNFSYNIPLANGNYNVTLKFAEIYWNAAGKRIFDVSIQGQQAISNLDIYAHAGKNAAYDVTIPVTVTNGMLDIDFTSIVDNAQVNAIEVTQVQPSNSLFDNAGGGQYTDTSGNVYRADTDYSGGATYSTNTAISGTGDGTLYQSLRYGNFSYNIPLANGNYNVTLKFAEIYWNAAGKRIFDVSIQGQQAISNLDIYAHAGKNAAYDVTIPVTVTNGMLDIDFTSIVDNAQVNAIEVTPK